MVFQLIRNLIPVKNYRKIRQEGDLLIVLSQNLDLYFLNDTAYHFYSIVDDKKTMSTILDEFKNTYDVSEEILKEDLTKLVRDLQWKRLLILQST